MLAKVYVMPRHGVLDAQGQAVEHALSALNFPEVQQVRQGKYFEIKLDDADPAQARERVEDMCRKLLANRVIEDYRFELVVPGASLPPVATSPTTLETGTGANGTGARG